MFPKCNYFLKPHPMLLEQRSINYHVNQPIFFLGLSPKWDLLYHYFLFPSYFLSSCPKESILSSILPQFSSAASMILRLFGMVSPASGSVNKHTCYDYLRLDLNHVTRELESDSSVHDFGFNP